MMQTQSFPSGGQVGQNGAFPQAQAQAPVMASFPPRTWQGATDERSRILVLKQMYQIYAKRRPKQVQAWGNKLPEFIKRLEEVLYRYARSKDEYTDVATLEHRLQAAARRIGGSSRPSGPTGPAGGGNSMSNAPNPSIAPTGMNANQAADGRGSYPMSNSSPMQQSNMMGGPNFGLGSSLQFPRPNNAPNSNPSQFVPMDVPMEMSPPLTNAFGGGGDINSSTLMSNGAPVMLKSSSRDSLFMPNPSIMNGNGDSSNGMAKMNGMGSPSNMMQHMGQSGNLVQAGHSGGGMVPVSNSSPMTSDMVPVEMAKGMMPVSNNSQGGMGGGMMLTNNGNNAGEMANGMVPVSNNSQGGMGGGLMPTNNGNNAGQMANGMMPLGKNSPGGMSGGMMPANNSNNAGQMTNGMMPVSNSSPGGMGGGMMLTNNGNNAGQMSNGMMPVSNNSRGGMGDGMMPTNNGNNAGEMANGMMPVSNNSRGGMGGGMMPTNNGSNAGQMANGMMPVGSNNQSGMGGSMMPANNGNNAGQMASGMMPVNNNSRGGMGGGMMPANKGSNAGQMANGMMPVGSDSQSGMGGGMMPANNGNNAGQMASGMMPVNNNSRGGMGGGMMPTNNCNNAGQMANGMMPVNNSSGMLGGGMIPMSNFSGMGNGMIPVTNSNNNIGPSGMVPVNNNPQSTPMASGMMPLYNSSNSNGNNQGGRCGGMMAVNNSSSPMPMASGMVPVRSMGVGMMPISNGNSAPMGGGMMTMNHLGPLGNGMMPTNSSNSNSGPMGPSGTIPPMNNTPQSFPMAASRMMPNLNAGSMGNSMMPCDPPGSMNMGGPGGGPAGAGPGGMVPFNNIMGGSGDGNANGGGQAGSSMFGGGAGPGPGSGPFQPSQQPQQQQQQPPSQLGAGDLELLPGLAAVPEHMRGAFIQKQQRWLLFLRHCAKCRQDENQCQLKAKCKLGKEFWDHIINCSNPVCEHTRCTSSKELLKHHTRCQNADCCICGPVKDYVKKTRNAQSASLMGNAAHVSAARLGTPGPTPAVGFNAQIHGGHGVPGGLFSTSPALPQPHQFSNSPALPYPHHFSTSPALPQLHQYPPCNAPLDPSLQEMINQAPLLQPYCPPTEFRHPSSSSSRSKRPHNFMEGGGNSAHHPTFSPPLPEGMKPDPSSSMPPRVVPMVSAPEQSQSRARAEQSQSRAGPEQSQSRVRAEQSQSIAGPDAAAAAATAAKAAALASAKRSKPVAELSPMQSRNTGTSLLEAFSADQIRNHLTLIRQAAEPTRIIHPADIVPSDLCKVCGLAKLFFEPPVLYCSYCAIKMKRHQVYYSTPSDASSDIKGCFCHSCYNGQQGDRILLDGAQFKKSDLTKRKNDDEIEEGWVACDQCENWVHQVCGMFNKGRNNNDVHYLCPDCLLEGLESGQRASLEVRPQSMLEAKDLPTCELSNYMEQHLNQALAQERIERAKVTGVHLSEIPPIDALTIRVVNSVIKKGEVKQRMAEQFASDGYPTEFSYRQRVLVMFQNIDGVDVCLFCMYVQEYGEDCPLPNRNCVYLSYLDSIKYFRPEVYCVGAMRNISMRTYVYQQLLISYLAYIKMLGFEQMYIWACPPMAGDDYILAMTTSCTATLPSKKRLAQTDCATGEAENQLALMADSGAKPPGKGKGSKKGDKSGNAKGNRYGSSHGTPNEQLMARLGEILGGPMREDFIVAHLKEVCSFCRGHVNGGGTAYR
eukprot:gene8174-1430_t